MTEIDSCLIDVVKFGMCNTDRFGHNNTFCDLCKKSGLTVYISHNNKDLCVHCHKKILEFINVKPNNDEPIGYYYLNPNTEFCTNTKWIPREPARDMTKMQQKMFTTKMQQNIFSTCVIS